jgi:serine/threonine-protein kinase
MLASAVFRDAERSRTMLRFLVERAIDGDGSRVKEYTVGVEALGRGVGFDPRTDPIVRAEASRLRARMDRYYAADGRDDPLLITLPKGTYVAEFRARGPSPAEAEAHEDAVSDRPARRALTWGLLGAAIMVLSFAAGGWLARRIKPSDVSDVMTLDVQLQSGGSIGSEVGADVAIAPDGSRVVFVSSDSTGVPRLRMRRFDGSAPMDLPGTEGARGPFISPDGRWVGFWSAGQLKKTALDGGSPTVLCDAADLLGASWSADGRIVASLDATNVLWAVPASGGTPRPVVNLSAQHAVPRWPQMLPDGKHVLYTALSAFGADGARIEVASIDDGTAKVIATGGTYARFVPPGYLIYVNQGALYAVRFDLDRLAVRGTPVPILDDVAYSPVFGFAQLDVSRTGTLIYRRAAGRGRLMAAFVDTLGRAEPIGDGAGPYGWPALSPDGSRLTLSTIESGVRSVLLFKIVNGRAERMGAPLVGLAAGVWTRESRFLIASDSDGMVWLAPDGGPSHRLIDHQPISIAWSFAPDGRMAYHAMSATTALDLWSVPVTALANNALRAGEPRALLATRSYEAYPSFSPDGKWLAYTSNESGTWEIYVRAEPDNGKPVRVSRGGGRIPRWSRVRRELLYGTDDQRVMVVGYDDRDGVFRASAPRLWTPVRLADTGVLPNFDVTPDGRRILALLPVRTGEDGRGENQARMVIGFTKDLVRRLP